MLCYEIVMSVDLRRVAARDGTALPVRIARGAGAAALVLAPGAGSSMDHPSLVRLQERLAAAGTTTVTFDFPYRVHRRGAPDRMPVLAAAYGAVVAAVRDELPPRLFIGGRSMGGRVASHVAAEGVRVDGLVFLAFPLHPPGRPGISRADHLARLTAPMLFVQGTNDAFARRDLLHDVLKDLPNHTLHPIEAADHGFRLPQRTGRTSEDVEREIVDTIVAWTSSIQGANPMRDPVRTPVAARPTAQRREK
jgi:predicted alpha/beta-hydrolase family hydrolase